MKKLWIVLDGKDAVGKSALFRFLKEHPMIRGDLPWCFLPEFSHGATGLLIKKILAEQRFFSLGPSTAITETLVLAADLVFKLETLPAGAQVVVGDRGPVSLAAYQTLRLLKQGSFSGSDKALTFVDNLLKALPVRVTTVLLTVAEEEMVRRIVARGEASPTREELDFLARAEELMKIIGPAISTNFIEIKTDGRELANLAKEIVDIVKISTA